MLTCSKPSTYIDYVLSWCMHYKNLSWISLHYQYTSTEGFRKWHWYCRNWNKDPSATQSDLQQMHLDVLRILRLHEARGPKFLHLQAHPVSG